MKHELDFSCIRFWGSGNNKRNTTENHCLARVIPQGIILLPTRPYLHCGGSQCVNPKLRFCQKRLVSGGIASDCCSWHKTARTGIVGGVPFDLPFPTPVVCPCYRTISCYDVTDGPCPSGRAQPAADHFLIPPYLVPSLPLLRRTTRHYRRICGNIGGRLSGS